MVLGGSLCGRASPRPGPAAASVAQGRGEMPNEVADSTILRAPLPGASMESGVVETCAEAMADMVCACQNGLETAGSGRTDHSERSISGDCGRLRDMLDGWTLAFDRFGGMTCRSQA